MENDIIKTKSFLKGDKIVVQYECSKNIIEKCSYIFEEKTCDKDIQPVDKKVFDSLKKLFANNPTQEEWNNIYGEIENKLTELGKNKNMTSELMELLLKPIICLVDNENLIDAIYVYPHKDIDWYINNFLDYFDKEFVKKMRMLILLKKNIVGKRFSMEDLLSIFLNMEKPDINEKEKIKTYIMSDATGLFKIGRSTDIQRRLLTLKIGNPTIRLKFYINGDFEKELHNKFTSKHIIGEWFALSDEDLNYIKELK